MDRQISKTDRRMAVIVNYVCVAAIGFVVHMGNMMAWSLTVRLVGIVACLVVGLFTFIRVYWRTGLWKLAHASYQKLDERQVKVMYDSLSHSYGVFTIVCLVIVYLNAVIERGPVPIVIAGSILYLAHTLPAAVVAWTEKEVLITG
jgi:hypothetical protein